MVHDTRLNRVIVRVAMVVEDALQLVLFGLLRLRGRHLPNEAAARSYLAAISARLISGRSSSMA